MRNLTSTSALVAALAALATLAPSVARADDKPDLHVRYDKGVVFTDEDGAFMLRLSLRTQFRYEATRTGDDGETTQRFFVPRSRLQFDGNVFGKDNRFKLDYSLADKGNFGYLRDFYVEHDLGGVWLRMGQWKRPFNRQELVSDFSSAMNERAITADFVGGGRDMGVAVHNDYEKSRDGLEWVVGLFNKYSGGTDRPVINTECDADGSCSTGAPTGLPGDFGPTLVARAGWNTGGIKGYSEGDLEGGGLRLAVGVAYKVDLSTLERTSDQTSALGEPVPGDLRIKHGVQVDAMLKVRGFDLQGGVYLMKSGTEKAELAGFAQFGTVVADERGLIAVRGAVIPTDDGRHLVEGRAAASALWHGHTWKWVNDAGVLYTTGRDAETHLRTAPELQVRSMAQLVF